MRRLLDAIPYFILFLWILWLIHPYLRMHPGTDAGIFSAVAMEMLNGHQLYAEVFESKPPAIFLLNALSLLIGREYHAIRITELLLLLGSAVLLLSRFRIYLKNIWAGLCLAFIFFGFLLQPELYSKGNQTELYATLCLLNGFALLIPQNRNALTTFSGGFFLALSPWFREFFAPAALITLVYFFYINPRRERIRLSSGFALPFLLFALWMTFSQGWTSWFDYLQYQFSYGSHAQESYLHEYSSLEWTLRMYRELLFNHYWWPMAVALLLLLAGFVPALNRKLKGLPVLASVLSMLQFAILSQSGYHFGHYYYLAIFPWILCLLWFFKSTVFILPKPNFFFLLIAIFSVLMLKPSRPMSDLFKGGLKGYTPDAITIYLRQHKSPADRLYCDRASAGHYYADTYMHSGLKFPLPIYHYFSLPMSGHHPEYTASQQLRKMQQQPPRFVIMGKELSLFLQRAFGVEWFQEHYQLILQTADHTQLYEYRRN